MDPNKDTRIQAYLDQEMTPEERRVFEDELDNNPELRTRLQRFLSLDKAIHAYGRRRLRQLVADARRQAEPLPAPSITFFDRTRFLWYARSAAIMVAGSVLLFLVAGWLVMNLFFCPAARLSSDYFIPPMRIDVAAGAMVNYKLAQEASRFYDRQQVDSLRQLMATGNVAPLVYLAHAYLRQEQFADAEIAFDELLERREEVQAYDDFQDMGLIKFNRLLARLGRTGDASAALAALDELRQDPDTSGELVRNQIEQVVRDLENPLWRTACLR